MNYYRSYETLVLAALESHFCIFSLEMISLSRVPLLFSQVFTLLSTYCTRKDELAPPFRLYISSRKQEPWPDDFPRGDSRTLLFFFPLKPRKTPIFDGSPAPSSFPP